MGGKERKYEMDNQVLNQVVNQVVNRLVNQLVNNATNSYSSGGLCIFWVDMTIDRTDSSYIVQSVRSNVRSVDVGKFSYT